MAPADVLLGKVRSMNELLKDMVKSVRRIAAELRPGILDDLGLAAAVEWQAKEYEQRMNIKTEVQTSLGEKEVPKAVATALFRILQESLTNVARHAQATSVKVSLKEKDGWVVLKIADDGRGITNEELNKTGAFGLMGMRERVIPLRGECEIKGKPGAGTTVRVSVPLEVEDTK
jgi:signal transduction histidine kinase